jgi:hypothetical protein
MAFTSHTPRMTLARLDPFFLSAIADAKVSLSDFMRRSLTRDTSPRLSPDQLSLAYLSREARGGITNWLQTAFGEFGRVLQEAQRRPLLLSHDGPTA